MGTRIHTVVIGGGHAGLNTSRALQRAGIDHVVLERGRVGETWRTQRWESFRLNTPSWSSALVDFDQVPGDPDGFMDVRQLCEMMQSFVEHFGLPIRENTDVHRVTRSGADFVVEAADGEEWVAENVIVCSGSQNVPKLPDLAHDLSGVAQLHAAEYRNPHQLEDGAVLVVGSAQSGCQIAEELADVGRTTILCASNVASVPRRHRGRDVVAWMMDMGVAHTPVGALEDPRARYAAQPMLSGNDGGHSISLHSLARRGVTVVGRLVGAEGTRLQIGDNLGEAAEMGLASLAQVRENIDTYIAEHGIEAPSATADGALEPDAQLAETAAIREIDVVEQGISTVIWATGFGGDFSYLDLDLEFDEAGVPIHDDGVSAVDGLYFVGFSWLRQQSSGLIYGSGLDAEFIADKVRTAAGVA
ncbi:MAG: NAD(P)/FAD-dependent oxidoreductase [Acidimicrobiales bacterium]|nr:NAD(P)/FAD-dependent oxidoreductase [Acidimicrobiales bacterium]